MQRGFSNSPTHEDIPTAKIARTSVLFFIKSFILAYWIRTGITIGLRALQLIRMNPKSLMSLEKIVGEKNVIIRVEAIRLGFAVGGFIGTFEFLRGILHKYSHKLFACNDDEKRKGWNDAIAGSVAGLSLVCLEKSERRSVSLYLFVRWENFQNNVAGL